MFQQLTKVLAAGRIGACDHHSLYVCINTFAGSMLQMVGR